MQLLHGHLAGFLADEQHAGDFPSRRSSASLAPGCFSEREDAFLHLPRTQTEKDKALAKSRYSRRVWRGKKSRLMIHAVTDEEGRSLDVADDSGARLFTPGSEVFDACVVGDQDHSCETFLTYFQRAPVFTQWTPSKEW